jgi:hypothetical protein
MGASTDENFNMKKKTRKFEDSGNLKKEKLGYS